MTKSEESLKNAMNNVGIPVPKKVKKGFSIILQVLGNIYLGLAMLFILANYAMIWYNDGLVAGWWHICDLLSPFNLINWLVTILTLSPGLLLLFLADKACKERGILE